MEIVQKFILDNLVNLKLVLPFDDIVLDKMICFENIISSFLRRSFKFDKDKLINKKSKFINKDKDLNAIDYYKDKELQTLYPLIVKLARALLALPHS